MIEQRIILTPTSTGVGLYTVSLGFLRALEHKGIKACLISPFTTSSENDAQSVEQQLADLNSPISPAALKKMMGDGQIDKLLDFVLRFCKHQGRESDVLVIQGVPYIESFRSYAAKLNYLLAKALSAEIILVAKEDAGSKEKTYEKITMEAENLGGLQNPKLAGCILNKIGAPVDRYGNTRIDLFDPPKHHTSTDMQYEDAPVKIIGAIPWKRKLMATNVAQISKHLDAKILNKESYKNNQVLHFVLIAANIDAIPRVVKPGVMLITSYDRSDVIITAAMAYLNGISIAGVILTGGKTPNKETLALCKKATDEGLPILCTETDSLRTSISLQNISTEISKKECEQIEDIKRYIATKIDHSWIENLSNDHQNRTMSPAAFRFQLMEKAKERKKTIVLPEGDDPRILSAAAFCSKKEIANIVLLGKKEEILSICESSAIELDQKIQIIDPVKEAPKYIDALVELRKHKGLTEKGACEALADPIVVATMMLKEGVVDGLVAGATTTTANVVSPALKIIKTAENSSLVSSIFFMCLENEVLVYGDCAVNQNPTAEQLASIAIQSADSARQFDIDPRVAMISYSTGSSGTGVDVEKVKMATQIVKEKRPDLTADGPLQYDAAKVPEVAKSKAPNSSVAGKATVFIFPDLNTANTTYKAVQRTAGVLSIGPMLQGLAKPVNDLSRGATIDDIIFTIAITAIQQ